MSKAIDPDRSGTTDLQHPSMVAGLIAIGKTVRAMMGLKLAEIDLRSGQDELLLALGTSKPQTVSQIAQTLEVRPSTVSKMLERLIRQGLLQRETREGDGRLTFVRITVKGVAKIDQIKDLRAAIDVEIGSALGANSITTSAADVEAVSKIVAARLHRLR